MITAGGSRAARRLAQTSLLAGRPPGRRFAGPVSQVEGTVMGVVSERGRKDVTTCAWAASSTT